MDTSFNSQPADVAQVWNHANPDPSPSPSPNPNPNPNHAIPTPNHAHHTSNHAHPTHPGPAKVWNLRGLANNTWHRVDVWY